MPGYSTEQYHVPLLSPGDNDAYLVWVLGRLGFNVGDDDLAQIYSGQISYFISQRAELTAEAQIHCVVLACPPGSQANNDYSTNARDKRLLTIKTQLDNILKRLGPNSAVVQYLIYRYSHKNQIYGLAMSDWDFISNTDGLFQRFSSDAQASY